MKRLRALILLLAVVLVFPAIIAQAEQPVRDSTAILSAQTVEEIRALNDELAQKTGYRLAVDVRHFLGGAMPDDYAKELLSTEDQPEKTVLLLAVIGEERYAAVAGNDAARALNAEAVNSLLSMHFRAPFQRRDYDAAVLQFAREAARHLALYAGTGLNALPPEQPQTTSAPAPLPTPQQEYESIKLPDLNSMLREPITPTEDPTFRRQRTEREDKGMSIGSIVVIGLVLSSLFGGKKKGKNGCGCGPLGWIFGVFGLSKLFGWRD